MTTVLNFARDSQGYVSYSPDFSTNKYSATLNNGTAESITVPSNYKVWTAAFSFQPGTNVWVARNTTATIPAGVTFAATSSDLNPGSRRVYAGDTLSFITDNTTADVGVMLYAVTQS